ncbi:terpene synthase family protein [Streptomyces sp. IMTB 2501]|uniref:terpene synthase family protein n=1 Tax=Streptomyces sp. IMTB 2501 TaxID=1776340 RepID=UPI00117FB6E8|nr:terpene synthase family protein [Streptomyces sp. IMTB 2501]
MRLPPGRHRAHRRRADHDASPRCWLLQLRHRRHIELADGYELRDEDLASNTVRAVTDIAAVILAWDNDIYSYSMEVENNIGDINLVTALADHEHLPGWQALAEAIRLRNQAMWCYMQHQNHLNVTLTPNHPLRRYLGSLCHHISQQPRLGTALHSSV